MKVAYIAHPIGGAPALNVHRVLQIVKEINLSEPNTVPFAPYIPDVKAMDDNIPEQRERGIKNDTHILRTFPIDEIRLYGDKISPGMWAEIEIGKERGITILPMTPYTEAAFYGNPIPQKPLQIDYHAFGKYFAKFRAEKYLTLRETSAEVGISFPVLSKLERGAKIDLETYAAACKWLAISMDEYLTK